MDNPNQIPERKHVNVFQYLLAEERIQNEPTQHPVLSSAEAAGLVFHDPSASLAKRRCAFQKIMDGMPDETIRYIDFHNIDFYKATIAEIGLHELLRSYMKEQAKLEKLFFADEPETVYLTYVVYTETKECRHLNGPALSWDVCAGILQREKRWVEDTGPWKAYITKYYPKIQIEGCMRELTAVFDETGEALDITTQMPITFPGFCYLLWTMDQLPRERDIFDSERADTD